MNKLEHFRSSLHKQDHAFSDTLSFIDECYRYSPSAFRNGPLLNAKGQNEGSCKLLGLILLEGFSAEEALKAFGEHYRHVLASPEGTDHPNIRALMATGLSGVAFEQAPLTRKQAFQD